MTNDSSNTDMQQKNTNLNVPRQMALAVICRGAQSGWHQLENAMKALKNDSSFKKAFEDSFSNQQGALIGSQQQLISSLIVNPSWVSQPFSPTDIFSQSVWLTLKIYGASKTIAFTLEEILTQKQNSNNKELFNGSIVKEMLGGKNGLVSIANNIVDASHIFSNYLKKINGNLESALNEYKDLSTTIEKNSISSKKEDMLTSIGLYASSITTANQIQQHLNVLEKKAAKVSCFAVVDNMTRAVQSLTNAWLVVKEQFETISNYDTKNLENLEFLENNLKLSQACTDWQKFSKVLNNFSKKAITIN